MATTAVNVATLSPVKLEPYMNPRGARTMAVAFVASQTLARGTVIGQVTASGLYKAYASGNSDGSQVPIGLLVYDIVVDASGNVVIGTTGSVADLTRGFSKTAEIYWQGTFLESDLTGLDANAVTVFKAREVGTGTAKMLVLE
jgi:hypothetical protein